MLATGRMMPVVVVIVIVVVVVVVVVGALTEAGKLGKAHRALGYIRTPDDPVDHLMSDTASNAARSGKTMEEYLAESGKTEEQLRAELRVEAENRVKTTLLIEQIAKVEQIAATPADVTQELEALSRQYGQPVARIRKALGNSLLSLMDGIVRNKTLDFLIDNAAVTEETQSPAS